MHQTYKFIQKRKKRNQEKKGKGQTKQRNAFDNTITHTGRRNKIYVCIPPHDRNLYSIIRNYNSVQRFDSGHRF